MSNDAQEVGSQSDASREADQPPATKQGGVNSSNPAVEGGVRASVTNPHHVWVGLDYLTVSQPRMMNPTRMFRALADLFKSSLDTVVSDHGYEGVDICGGYGAVLLRECRDSADADVLVRLPGRAMEWLRESRILCEDPASGDSAICAFFRDHDFRATRIDVAMDTSDPEVTPRLVEKHLREHAFTSRARMAGRNGSWVLNGDDPYGEGETVYIGGRMSSRYLRCYDKQAEVFRKLRKKIPHLTRFELEMKYEAAQKAMEFIAGEGAQCIPAIFKGWIDFKDLDDTATRVDRRRQAPWWERMVSNETGIALGLTRGIATPEKSVHWIKHQVAKTLLLLKKHGLMGEIERAMAAKEHKIKPSELERWSDYIARLKTIADGWSGSEAANPG